MILRHWNFYQTVTHEDLKRHWDRKTSGQQAAAWRPAEGAAGLEACRGGLPGRLEIATGGLGPWTVEMEGMVKQIHP